jgi:hypothetical protein
MLPLPRTVQWVVRDAIRLLDQEPSPPAREELALRARAEIARRCRAAAMGWAAIPAFLSFVLVFGLGFAVVEDVASELLETALFFFAGLCGFGVGRLCLDAIAEHMRRAACSADDRLKDPFW